MPPTRGSVIRPRERRLVVSGGGHRAGRRIGYARGVRRPVRLVLLPPVEGVVARGRSIATVESMRYTGAVRVPVDAEILERNPAVRERPRLLNDAPYGEGWVARVRPTRPEEVPRYLESAAQVAGRLEERIRTQRIRCWPATPDLELYEIGIECSAVLTMLNEELAR